MGTPLRLLLASAVAVALTVPLSLEGGQGMDAGAAPESRDPGLDVSGDPDFFFGRPNWSLTFRGGGFFPRARGQFFEFAFEEFTLGRNDLRGLTGGADLGVWISNHFEAVGSMDFAGTTQRSQHERFDEELPDGRLVPVEQTTRIRQGPSFTLGVKAYPLARGERLSRLIWIPYQVTPYASAGMGGMSWGLEQWGDFVDEREQIVFTDEFRTGGFSFVRFAGAGVDFALRPRVALNLDSRYIWGEGRMDEDFIEFTRPLDLSGFRVTAGLSFRF
jgi:hypothetical protein